MAALLCSRARSDSAHPTCPSHGQLSSLLSHAPCHGRRARPRRPRERRLRLCAAVGAPLQLSVLNALNGQADDIEYAYPSRLRGEVSDGVSDIHFHPVEPRPLRLSLDYKWRNIRSATLTVSPVTPHRAGRRPRPYHEGAAWVGMGVLAGC